MGDVFLNKNTAWSNVLSRLIPEHHRKNEGKKKADFSILGSVVSDAGYIRSNNEDNYILGIYRNTKSASRSEMTLSPADIQIPWLFAGVFDGMGGGEQGELAAHDTAEIFQRTLSGLDTSSSRMNVDLTLRKAFLEANNRIVALRQTYRILGTTGTVLCTDGTDLKIYHLGDSRAYLIRGNELMQLTKDQTLAQMKMDIGIYREDAPDSESDRHKLTDYIGRDWTQENTKPVESQWIPIQPNDCVLLCSDGLYDMCTDEEISDILQKNNSVEQKTAALVKAALANGGEDNITCLVVSFLSF